MAIGTIPKSNPKAGMCFPPYVVSTEVTTIPNNADLNSLTYTATGQYSCSTNAGAQSLSNCPTNYGFGMLVYNLTGSNSGTIHENVYDYRVRIIMTYQGAIYIQTVSSYPGGTATYGTWKTVQIA